MGYYFIVVLAQLYILTPVLMHLNRKLGWYGLMLVLIFNMASFLALYLSRVFNYIAHIPAVLPFYTWIIYYEAGLFMAGRYEEAHTTSKTRFYILPALLFSLLVSILEAGVMSSKYNNPDMASFAGKYSSFLYSACVILCFIFGREYFGRMPKLLSTIGYYSLGIYLVHMIVLSGVVEVFRNITAISSFQPMYQLILVVITLSICLALIVAAGKLLPEFFCNGILGFGSRSGRLPVCIHRPSERGKQGKVGVGCGVEEA